MTTIEQNRSAELEAEINKRIPKIGIVIFGILYFDFGTDVSWSAGSQSFRSRITTRQIQEYCFHSNVDLVSIIQKENSYDKLIEILADLLEPLIRTQLNQFES